METDPENAELIEKLMADDDPYHYRQADEDDANDSDDAKTHARKKRRARGKAQTAKGEEAGRLPGEDKGKSRGRGRLWTQDEEQLFLQALGMYGRSWKRCAEHVGTRDSRSVASHAQKHFIKLCLQGEPLPDKVAESGVGYTLSGKPLDPTSPSALAYGFKKDVIEKLSDEKMAIVRGGILMERLEGVHQAPETGEAQEGMHQDTNPMSTDAAQPVDQLSPSLEACVMDIDTPPKEDQLSPSLEASAMDIDTSPKDDSVKKGKTSKGSAPARKRPAKDDSWEYMRKYRTDYALNRPQRAAARNRRVQMGSTSESIQLIECEEFMDTEEGVGITQPFTIDIVAEALILMDFHSHLSEFEIIGLLAGTWDAEAHHLTIREAFPCQRAEGSGTRTSVELDPTSEVNARSDMVRKGLVGTGWYHSHPVFSATPSLKDIENQRNYQTLFRLEESKAEPFIGLIISPYDINLPAPKSRTCGFYVMETNQGIKPFRLRFNVINRLERYTLDLVNKCEAVLHMLESDSCRMDLKSVWRKWTFLKDDKETGDALTKVTKLKLSLLPYFTEDSIIHAKALGQELVTKIEQIWKVDLQDSQSQ